jgi:VCBS repeat-containing protein
MRYRTIAGQGSGYWVNITVEAVDGKTKTIAVTLEGAGIQSGQK